ncbi:HMG-box [Pluteus cervinus]|uniref:HMG-box n=1 Tax=Pluteus cervinus TaxID=181527 RepID=A0ACD3AJ65_9AGAR|nr:HMG-box [Pluteus cervinus]
MADTMATVEYQSLQLAATLSAAADSLRNCANVAEAFANILRQTTATGAASSSVQGASNHLATPAAKAGKRKAGAIEDGTEEGGKRKRKRQPKDPNAPKRPASSYIIFQNEVRKSMKESHPDVTNTELVALISKQWSEMSEEDKSIYNQAMASAKERYSLDKKAYESRTPEEVAAANAASAAAIEAKKASRGNRSKLNRATPVTPAPPHAAPVAAATSPSNVSSGESTSGDESGSDHEAHHDEEEGEEEDDSDSDEPKSPRRQKKLLQVAHKTPKAKKQKKNI